MNKVIQDIEELEKEIMLKDKNDFLYQRGQLYIARAILKLALVHAGNNVAEVRKPKPLPEQY